MTDSPLSPTDIFYKYLEVLPATTQAMLDECHRIRYQAYCVDSQWEDDANGKETDKYDSHSIHYLLRFCHTKTSVGTTRLVLPQVDHLESSFPSQEICESRFRHLPLKKTAEGSRIVITGFSRQEEFNSLTDARVVIPNMILGLVAGYRRGCKENNIIHLCCTLDSGFIRLLERKSLYFDKIGATTFIHGKNRQPCSIEFATLMRRCKEEKPELWQIITSTS